MDVAYWIVAGLLAVLYLLASGGKVLQSQEQLRPMMGWVDRVPMPVVRLIGALEILGAIGLILPPLTGTAVGLAPRGRRRAGSDPGSRHRRARLPRRDPGDRSRHRPAARRRGRRLACHQLVLTDRTAA